MSDPAPEAAAAIAKRLVDGAAIGILRLIAVACAGLVGTVVLARFLGPGSWGVYSAVWSITLFAAAVSVHGVRDRLAADGRAAAAPGVARAVAAVLAFIALGCTSTIIAVHGPLSDGETLLLVAAGLWLAAYPFRVPAMIEALQGVRPVRVMVLESIDAVFVPVCAMAALLVGVDDISVMAYGVMGAATIGMILSRVWRPIAPRNCARGSAWRAWLDARDLAAYQFVATGRELAIPVILLGTAGSTAAGEYGLAVPLGAMVALALAAAAQPAYGALVALRNDPAQVAVLTNVVQKLLASIVVITIPTIWLLGPWFLSIMFGESWSEATTTILLVMTAFAINAAIVPWVNVLIANRDTNRILVVAQGCATGITVGAACFGSVVGATGVAAVFVTTQLLFGLVVAQVARRQNSSIEVRDTLWFVFASGIATMIVLWADGIVGATGLLIAIAIVTIAPSRHGVRNAWRGVLQTRR